MATPPEMPPEEVETVLQLDFTAHSLDGLIVNRLLANDGRMLAATDKGLYSQDDNRSWQLLTSADWDIRDVIAIDSQHLMMTLFFRGQNQLVESVDGGISWQSIRYDFGGDPDRGNETINRLLWSDEKQVLFGIGTDVLAQSDDGGTSWQLLSGFWHSFGTGSWSLAYQPTQETVMYGGQGAIENPILRKVNLEELSEEFIDVSDLLPLPSTIRDIKFDVTDPNRVYVAGEGGIITSGDLGENWSPLLVNDNSRFYFEVIQHPDNPSHFYTAGWNKVFDDPQPLVVEISRDNGVTWQQFQHPDPLLFGGVRSMSFTQNGDQVIVYLGLYKGGVVEATVTH